MSSRDRIVDAAAQLMRTVGLTGTTTRQIARLAGFSEAMLYKHFDDKADLFLAVLAERTPGDLSVTLGRLPGLVGGPPVADTLADVAMAALRHYRIVFPMAAALFAEPTLLAAHRDAMYERAAGPARPLDALTSYLSAERAVGRLPADVDPTAVAELLLGACLHHAFILAFDGQDVDPAAAQRFAVGTVTALDIGFRRG